MIHAFFRLQGIKVLWRIQFLGYLRTLSLKFQKARTKIEVVLSQPTANRADFWNFKCKVPKYSRTCILHNTLIPWSLNNPESPTVHTVKSKGKILQQFCGLLRIYELYPIFCIFFRVESFYSDDTTPIHVSCCFVNLIYLVFTLVSFYSILLYSCWQTLRYNKV